MSRRKWHEEEIEQTLSDLPAVKDRQSKDELYRKIEQSEQSSSRMNKTKQTSRKPRFVPLMAAAAAAVIMLLIIPSFLNGTSTLTGGNESDNDPSTAGVSEDNENDSADQRANENETDNAPNDELNNSSDEPSNESSNEPSDNQAVYENEADQNAENSEEPSSNEAGSESDRETYEYPVLSASVLEETDGVKHVTLSVSDENRSSAEEAVKESLSESDPTSNKTMQSIREIERDKENRDEMIIDFEEEHELASLTSNEYESLEFVIEEVFSAYGIEAVQFTTAGEPGLSFGPAGDVEALAIPNEAEGYYVSEEDNRLISARAAGEHQEDGDWVSIEETVEEMKEADQDNGDLDIVPAIPDVVEINQIDVVGQEASLYYTAEEELSDEEIEHFFQSVRLTGAKYDLEKLELFDKENGEDPVITYEYDNKIIIE